MVPFNKSSSADWSSDFSSIIDQIQDETIKIALTALALGGVLLLVFLQYLSNPQTAIAISLAAFLLTFFLFTLLRKSPDITTILLVLGLTGFIFAVQISQSLPLILFLLILPLGISTIGLSRQIGVLTALIFSVTLTIFPEQYLQSIPSLRFFVILSLWISTGLIFIALRPLLTTVQWTWYSIKESRSALERARDFQAQLLQALEDLKNANVQLTRLNQLASHLVQIAEDERRAKEQFVANVSHELRTPLNMIIGFSEMIVLEPDMYGQPLPPALLADLTIVLRNSKHLSSLIDDVLDLSQIEVGQMAITKERVSLVEIIKSAVLAVTPLYTSKNLDLHMEAKEDLPFVFCDSTRIREVILNLLSNAGRYTESGGVSIKVIRDAGYVIVSVTDTGPGISPEDQAKLFKPFYRLEQTRQRNNRGTGLGLSISKKFVELHDGNMWVESKPNIGSTFFFSLPINPVIQTDKDAMRWFNPYQPFEERVRIPTLDPPVIHPRMLVVDPSTILQRVLSRYFSQMEMIFTDNINTAMEEIKETPVQLIIINDDKINISPLSALQTNMLPYGITTIICSLPNLGEITSNLGVQDYLVKPISRDSLLASITHIDKKIGTILVVDDEPDIQRLFSRMLTMINKGYRVLRADNGRLALDILQHEAVDLIYLDLVMPEMTGYEFINALQKDPTRKDIPVILISARDPFSQPIYSQSMTVTRTNGLSMRDLIASIKAVHEALLKEPPTDNRAPAADLFG